MDFRNYNRAWAFVFCLLVSTLIRAYGANPPSTPIEFHIEGGDATRTLTEFSTYAALQLMFDYNVVKGQVTKTLDGKFKPADALRILLAETGLEFDFVN